ncbi:putative E3 ubiquitin-protein ligase XBAT34 [Cornus florida]|uniref:putative E3 ubiquitin-protein ligase XBAT34 n=1 Tax=Cornus florida TaxID=4283 RepID=UPI002898728A|nr:putative E3 ubiquitin-protein ligase XBAT34 [Cornus florida]XP_059626027.1 putative E3 ubiquitin-protein ligase XBAT34 [Cornus florida]
MGQQQSKEELLYEQVIVGNVEAIKALCADGAGLEWIDKDGKTPLIVACMIPELLIVAKTLIELGANVNAYRPGRNGGTPLHHAAKRGLGQSVKLLLSSGANPLVRNDDVQTPLDVARMRGFSNVVRAVESHICFFSGWLREFYGPGFLEAFAPQLLSRKIWAVIIPCGSYNPTKPLKLELVIYSTMQDAQPRTVVALWKANIEEQNFQQPNPALIIFDKSTKTRYKFAPANDGDRYQLECLYNACRGTPQVVPPPVLPNTQTSVQPNATQTATEAAELAMSINASIQSGMEDRPPLHPNNHLSSEANNLNGWENTTNDTSHNGWGALGGSKPSEASSSGWIGEPAKEDNSGWSVPVSKPTSNPTQDIQTPPDNVVPIVQTSNAVPALVSSAPPTPSAPPVPEDILEGAVHYPSIDLSPVDMYIPSIEHGNSTGSEAKDEGGSSSCVICWEAPVEGACIPCGHMAGCMSCLNEIKAKKGDCPVCRAKINQIIRLYAV